MLPFFSYGLLFLETNRTKRKQVKTAQRNIFIHLLLDTLNEK